MVLDHFSNDKSELRQRQATDFFETIFSQQAGGFLEIRAFPGPRQFFFPIPSEISKAAALVSDLLSERLERRPTE